MYQYLLAACKLIKTIENEGTEINVPHHTGSVFMLPYIKNVASGFIQKKQKSENYCNNMLILIENIVVSKHFVYVLYILMRFI